MPVVTICTKFLFACLWKGSIIISWIYFGPDIVRKDGTSQCSSVIFTCRSKTNKIIKLKDELNLLICELFSNPNKSSIKSISCSC